MKKSNMLFLILAFFIFQLDAQINESLLSGTWKQVYTCDANNEDQSIAFGISDIVFLENNRMKYELHYDNSIAYETVPDDSIVVFDRYQMNIKLLTDNSLVYVLNKKGSYDGDAYYVYSRAGFGNETPEIKEYFSSIRNNKETPDEEKVYKGVDIMPVYPGCEEENFAKKKECADRLMSFHIYENIKYPLKASKKRIQGNVVVRLVVEKDGTLTNFEIIKDIGGGCGEEALRVIKSMPAWEPGLVDGKPVRTMYSIPVRFKLF